MFYAFRIKSKLPLDSPGFLGSNFLFPGFPWHTLRLFKYTTITSIPTPKISPSINELDLPNTLAADKKRLQEVDVPIVTTSASFRSDIFKSFGEKSNLRDRDIVFSRGHFSMSVALLQESHELGLSSWLIDPINYVSKADWNKLKTIVFIGQLIAKFPFLKHVKDSTDALTRGNLPITRAITKPLLFATAEDDTPIISVHYETGNILAKTGRTVLQVVTDPHIRPQYLREAGRKNITFAVFNTETKKEFLQKTKAGGVDLEGNRIVVTGPPVDPRVVRARKKKSTDSIKQRPLRLAITTGGLGQNSDEIQGCLKSLAEKVKNGEYQLILYASTLPRFKEMYEDFAKSINVSSEVLDDESAPIRMIYSTSVVEANQKLIEYAFSWADGFITKPSGDMAYDAAAAGCFILSLSPWGTWEKNVQKIFSNLSILKEADSQNLSKQLEELEKDGWLHAAINNALKIDKLFLNGAKNIVELQQRLAKGS